jgi:polyribonucleotide nucleotidyltransferase
MNLVVAGTADAVIMVEGSSKEVSEETLIAAIEAALAAK